MIKAWMSIWAMISLTSDKTRESENGKMGYLTFFALACAAMTVAAVIQQELTAAVVACVAIMYFVDKLRIESRR